MPGDTQWTCAPKLTVRPYIPLLKESHIRKRFFEPEQFKSVKNHLPVHLQPIVAFVYITGWRMPSEILPLEWRQVDMKAGEVRLDLGTTKNDDGRVCLLESPSGRRSTDSAPRSNAVRVANSFEKTQTGLRSSSVRVERRRRGERVATVATFTETQKARALSGQQDRAWHRFSPTLGHVGRAARWSFRRRAVRSDDGDPRPRGSPRCRHHRAA
jgi:integrase